MILSTDRVKKSLVSRTMYIKVLSLWHIGAPRALHKRPALLPGLGHERQDGLRKALAVWSARLRPSGVLPTVTATFGRPRSETGTHHDDLANVIAVVSERLPQHGEQGGGALRVVGMRRANFLR